jgi:hypothetical protein
VLRLPLRLHLDIIAISSGSSNNPLLAISITDLDALKGDLGFLFVEALAEAGPAYVI